MRDIMERVLEEEEKATKRIEEARLRTQALKGRADEEAESMVAQSRTRAIELIKERIESARAAGRDLAIREAAEEEKKNQGLYEDARAKIPALAQEIASMVRATGIRKD